jgi:predicted GH43/DUF377 family glycosyl hydrolase
MSNSTTVKRASLVLRPDPKRVVLRPLRYATDAEYAGILARVLSLNEKEVHREVDFIFKDFSSRHRHLTERLLDRTRRLEKILPLETTLSTERKLLIGAMFSYEYSPEAAALFNPSILSHPDQTKLPQGSLRFLLSLRSTGEGHISSISFRSGVIDAKNNIKMDPVSRYLAEPDLVENPDYQKALFSRKLSEMKLDNAWSQLVMNGLGDTFKLIELRTRLRDVLDKTVPGKNVEDDRIAGGMWLLAISNYEIKFSQDQELSERIIFPVTSVQSNGVEDVRLVSHVDDLGKKTIFGTYTAYDGRNILPQLFETEDFGHFKFATLNGSAVKNKGMALFPRMINGHYAMLSRQDGENIYLMYSDNIHFWYEAKMIFSPLYPWEFNKTGNCGVPLETPEGWLVLSHGVGPMRRYVLGAFLLDLKDPSKVIGRLKEPLMTPLESEREGYVPNVLYTCGAMVHGDQLLIPYGMSDSATGFALVSLSDLLAQLTSQA